jgi:LysR family hydrogen peroxide-inducible transcriptional activator
MSTTALPTFRQLRHLVALHEAGHFGRAAEACFVTQSTLSASIKELEDLLGVALVDRSTRKVVFTPLGSRVVEKARELVAGAEELAASVRAQAEPLAGPLKLGVIPTIGPFLLPGVLPGLRRRYPRLQLYLREDLSARLCEMLGRGELDAVLIALPYDCGDVETASVLTDPFELACRSDHPLAKRRRIAPDDIESQQLLLLAEGHCLREHALAACSLRGRAAGAPFEATSLHTIVQMVDNGLGVTLLPRIAIAAGITRGSSLVTRPFGPRTQARDIGLAWRRGTRRRPEFELLARELAELAHPQPARG